MNKNYRIHTNITKDTFLNVDMKQDFDFLEVLSLKLRQKDAYRLHSSNYGVIVGRVLANDAFGIPNAKISVFIERDMDDSNEIKNIYPYSEIMSRDSKGRRYNLLPDYSDDDCYRVVGTFPRKRYLLDDNVQLEVYEKYWKYTTVTNQSGDYMLFAVPTGGQQIHVDIDLSDIGILSQRPRDFVYKGHNLEEFDSPSQFKESTNLDSLQQIISQNKSVNVYPFWGDSDNGPAVITRCDIQVNYKFEPTCVFMGSIISDNDGNSIGHKCAPGEDNGLNSQLVAGEGTIEMIRKTTDGLVEEFPIKGNALIDADGVWCYQIPMNLDYVGTDEYGNIVPTDNPSKGIPTRTQVRFRFSKTETGDEGFSRHTAKYLVPMNPIPREDDDKYVIPTTQAETGIEMERMYNFGSNTPQSCFRDLYWNNVYSVKNYIPKVQVAHRAYAPNYSALKGSNLVDNQNSVPFNKLRVDLPFTYVIICILFTVVMYAVLLLNGIISFLHYLIYEFCFKVWKFKICPFSPLGWVLGDLTCISLSPGLGNGGDNTAYYPGCWSEDALDKSDCPEDMEGTCVKSTDEDRLEDKIQQSLAGDYKIIKLDFYQDWLNGTLYMPLWYWRKRKKKKFLFITISGAKNEFCDCDREYSRLKTFVTCNMAYEDLSLGTNSSTVDEGENRWHKKRSKQVRYRNGVIKGVKNKDDLTAYYYTAYQPTTNDPVSLPIDQRTRPFQFIKLYATDIILLGNLNEDNLYGIPQLFKALPSTTSNIPPIATVYESLTDDERQEISNYDTDDSADKGTTITTGMDWGYDGDEQTPTYKDGLFMDLKCTSVGTKAKACINVERLSELGVNPDMTFNMAYSNGGNDVKYGLIDSDGFVTKFELDDLENRAMFATLNHIGFIPQDYQDSIGSYPTQVMDERTGYLIPKFKYIYPVDFDGRMQPIMSDYRGGFEQSMYDEQDQAYLTFRFGAEKSDKYDDNSERRIRHFYYHENGKYEMPLYNNSFYFYFGINKGNTAIDKFNKMYYAPCFQHNVTPFTSNITSQGKSYCPATYKKATTGYNGYAYIWFNSDDISSPYTYTLYDSRSNIIVSESGMTDTEFVIGGTINDEGKLVMNKDGMVAYQTQFDEDEETHEMTKLKPIENQQYLIDGALSNQTYTLKITDANGRSITERVELKIPKVGIDYDSHSLNTKFYSTGATRMDYICSDDTEFYGKIILKTFNVDGYSYFITAATPMSYDSTTDTYKIILEGDSIDFSTDTPTKLTSAKVLVKVGAINSPNVGWVRDCLCDTGNTVYRVNGQNSYIAAASAEAGHQYWFGVTDPAEDERQYEHEQQVTLFVYQPNRFTLTISQLCPDEEEEHWYELEDNTSSEMVSVLNGENFNAFLNGMPVKFMLGTVSDSTGATVANESKFYKSEVVTNPLDSHISGWYGLHQEDSYRFNMSESQVLLRNTDMWKDFVQFNTAINTHEAKMKILAFKFNKMFSLAAGGYVIDNATTFQYKTVGGISPVLYRSVAPKYNNASQLRSIYVLKDGNRVNGSDNYPNIVGKNYSGHTDANGPAFNDFYDNKTKVGNYFAAFTNNGGYTSKTEIDESIKVMKIPNFAKVTPANSEKPLGRDVTGDINTFSQAHTKNGKYQPYLRGMFVDRRLDFDLVVFAPAFGTGTNLYPASEAKKNNIWKYGRVSGVTYNGVEMSYDKDYNIISATLNEDGSVAATNKRLEYSYNFSDADEDAKTYYNSEENMVWENDESDGQIIKRFYDASFVGSDIRNYFWSSFNKNRLVEESLKSTNIIDKAVPYIYKYPSTSSMYNGDFNRNNVIQKKNYPTVRLIDVGNIMGRSLYNLDIKSCSYNMNARTSEDGSITAEVRDGGGVSIDMSFSSPISFVAPNSAGNDYANLIYERKGIDKGYVLFKAQSCNISFKINSVENNEFDIYTSVPRIIKVLPYPHSSYHYDGLSYIKTVTPNGEIAASGSLNDIIDSGDVLLHRFEHPSNSFISYITGGPDMYLPEGVEMDDGLRLKDGSRAYGNFFRKDDDFITSDESDFQNIVFSKNGLSVNNVQIFTILVNRIYLYRQNDNLKRGLRILETGDMYDCRPIYMKINNDFDPLDTKKQYTFIEKRALGGVEVEVNQEDEQGGDEEEPMGGTGDTYVHVQTVTFDLYAPAVDNPQQGACEAMMDYSKMGFTFRFTNDNDDVFDIEPSDITSEEVKEGETLIGIIVHLKVKWTQDMGVFADNEWRNSTRCSMFAKTSSGFVYKLSEFTFNTPSQPSYDPGSKTSTIGAGERERTNVQIYGLN